MVGERETMTLSIFDGLGDGAVVWPHDREVQGMLAIEVLDAVQTIADVLVDDVAYKVRFAPEATAYTDFAGRTIVVTAAPLVQGGRPLSEIVDIITGFAVHEIGHARADDALSGRVAREWPGKVTPGRLCNILQDVRLEQRIIDDFRGLEGVFDAAFEFVVGQDPTAYAEVRVWPEGLADRLNFVGSVVRYRPWSNFASDSVTQAEVEWWERWGAVTGQSTDDELFQLVKDAIDHLKVSEAAPPLPPGPGPEPVGPGRDKPEGEPEDEPIGTGPAGPDDDELDDEPKPTEGEGKGEDKPDGESDDESGKAGGESEGKAQDTGASQREGETLDREESDAKQGTGGGGSGKAITEASDDVDAGLEPDKLAKSVDEVNSSGRDYSIQYRADNERGAEHIKAGAFGTMKVRVRL